MPKTKDEQWQKQAEKLLAKKSLRYQECLDFIENAKVSDHFKRGSQRNVFSPDKQNQKKQYIGYLKKIVNSFCQPIEERFEKLLEQLLTKSPEVNDYKAFTNELEINYINAYKLRQVLKGITQQYISRSTSSEEIPKKKFEQAKNKVILHFVEQLKNHKIVLQNHQESLRVHQEQLLSRKQSLVQENNQIMSNIRETINAIEAIKQKYNPLFVKDLPEAHAQGAKLDEPPLPPPPPPALKQSSKTSKVLVKVKSGNRTRKNASNAVTVQSIKSVKLKKPVVCKERNLISDTNESVVTDFETLIPIKQEEVRTVRVKSVSPLITRDKLFQSLNETIPSIINKYTRTIAALNAEIGDLSLSIVSRRKYLEQVRLMLIEYQNFDQQTQDYMKECDGREKDDSSLPRQIPAPAPPPPPPQLRVPISAGKHINRRKLTARSNGQNRLKSSFVKHSVVTDDSEAEIEKSDKEKHDEVLIQALKRRRQVTGGTEVITENDCSSEEEIKAIAMQQAKQNESILKHYLGKNFAENGSVNRAKSSFKPTRVDVIAEQSIIELGKAIKDLNGLDQSYIASKLTAALEPQVEALTLVGVESNEPCDSKDDELLNELGDVKHELASDDEKVSYDWLREEILRPILLSL